MTGGRLLKVILFLVAACGAADRDFYAILGVAKAATKQKIKSSYRKLSLKWHPDKNVDNKEEAESRFMDIGYAYTVLSDPDKREKYDKYGEAGLVESAGGAAGFKGDAYNVFNMFFGSGNHTGSGDVPDLFGTKVSGVVEFSREGWTVTMEEQAHRRNVVVVFYWPKCAGCKDSVKVLQEFADKFVGIVQVGGVNCARRDDLCHDGDDEESVVSNSTASPLVMYYGPGDAKALRHPAGDVSYATLSRWVAKVMGDFCQPIRTVEQLQRWLSTEEAGPKFVFLTNKKVSPPQLKALSVDFRGRASFGVVFADAEKRVFAKFRTKEPPSLLHVLNTETLEVEQFDQELKAKSMAWFVARAVAMIRKGGANTGLLDLTLARLRDGDCAPKDKGFCLLLFDIPGAKGQDVRDAFRKMANRLREAPVKVFSVQSPVIMDQFKLLPGQVVLYRPKKLRFKLFEGDAASVAELAAFVDFSVGGEAPLEELLSAALDAPRDEL